MVTTHSQDAGIHAGTCGQKKGSEARSICGLSREEVTAADQKILDTFRNGFLPSIEAALNDL
jgi:hypothetical protein